MIPYFPAEGGGFRLSLGLKVLADADWIEIDGNYTADLAEKARLLQSNEQDVFRALPGTEAAQQALIEVLTAHLAAHLPDRVPDLPAIDPAAPLKAAAAMVQEDILLLQPSPEGHRLIAAILCFPTRWRPADKIGQPLAAIHGPVPGYADKLGRQMDRLFAGMTDDRILWRQNFSLLDDAALFQPGGHFKEGAGLDLTQANIGENLWFRVERQTVRVLPGTDVTVFTVRIHQARLQDVVKSPERASDLLSVVDAMPPDMKRYKSLPGFELPLRAWLQERIR